MRSLKPNPTFYRQFSYRSENKTFSAEISSTNGLGRVYADACDEGLTIVGKTGREVVFVVTDEKRDAEGDLLLWNLRSLCGEFNLVLFND